MTVAVVIAAAVVMDRYAHLTMSVAPPNAPEKNVVLTAVADFVVCAPTKSRTA